MSSSMWHGGHGGAARQGMAKTAEDPFGALDRLYLQSPEAQLINQLYLSPPSRAVNRVSKPANLPNTGHLKVPRPRTLQELSTNTTLDVPNHQTIPPKTSQAKFGTPVARNSLMIEKGHFDANQTESCKRELLPRRDVPEACAGNTSGSAVNGAPPLARFKAPVSRYDVQHSSLTSEHVQIDDESCVDEEGRDQICEDRKPEIANAISCEREQLEERHARTKVREHRNVQWKQTGGIVNDVKKSHEEEVEARKLQKKQASETQNIREPYGEKPKPRNVQKKQTSCIGNSVIEPHQDKDDTQAVQKKQSREIMRGVKKPHGEVEPSADNRAAHKTRTRAADPKGNDCNTRGNPSGKEKVTVLEQWTIKPYRDGTTCVEGYRRGLDKEDCWHSSAVVKRLRPYLVATQSGTLYQLAGPLHRQSGLAHGYPGQLLTQFRKGFPPNWQALLEADWDARNAANNPKELEDMERQFEELEETTIKITIEPNKRLSHPNRKVKQELKPAQQKQKQRMNSSITQSPAVVHVRDLPRTRSGRRVKPPLAWWKGQRAKYHTVLDETIIEPGSAHASFSDTIIQQFSNEKRAVAKINASMIELVERTQKARLNRSGHRSGIDSSMDSDCSTGRMTANDEAHNSARRQSDRDRVIVSPLRTHAGDAEDSGTESSVPGSVEKAHERRTSERLSKKDAACSEQPHSDSCHPPDHEKDVLSMSSDDDEEPYSRTVNGKPVQKVGLIGEPQHDTNVQLQNAILGIVAKHKSDRLTRKPMQLVCYSQKTHDARQVASQQLTEDEVKPTQQSRDDVDVLCQDFPSPPKNKNSRQRRDASHCAQHGQSSVPSENDIDSNRIHLRRRGKPSQDVGLGGKRPGKNRADNASGSDERGSNRQSSRSSRVETRRSMNRQAQGQKASATSKERTTQKYSTRNRESSRDSSSQGAGTCTGSSDEDMEEAEPVRSTRVSKPAARRQKLAITKAKKVTPKASDDECDLSDDEKTAGRSARRSTKSSKPVASKGKANAKRGKKSINVDSDDETGDNDPDGSDSDEPKPKRSGRSRKAAVPKRKTNTKQKENLVCAESDAESVSDSSDGESDSEGDEYVPSPPAKSKTSKKVVAKPKTDTKQRKESTNPAKSKGKVDRKSAKSKKPAPKQKSKTKQGRYIANEENTDVDSDRANRLETASSNDIAPSTETKRGVIPELPEEDEETKAWTEQEIQLLQIAMTRIDPTDYQFWEKVGAQVGRTAEECQSFQHSAVPSAIKKKPAKPNQSEKVLHPSQITGGVGTMKRKRQFRELLDNHNADYEDDFFDSTPFKKAKPFNFAGLVDSSMSEMWKNVKQSGFQTPGARTPRANYSWMPTSTHKTPASSAMTPGLLRSVDRNAADAYIHQLKNRKHDRLPPGIRKSLEITSTPKSGLLSSVPSSTVGLFEEKRADDSGDSEPDDYYFSDDD